MYDHQQVANLPLESQVEEYEEDPKSIADLVCGAGIFSCHGSQT